MKNRVSMTTGRKALAAGAMLLLWTGLSHAVPVSGKGSWETTLQARDIDGQAVALSDASAVFFYDTELDVTWLRQASTNSSWAQSQAWVDALNVGGFDDWRLPLVAPVNGSSFNYAYSGYANDGSADRGYNISAPGSAYPGSNASELAHLFNATLGNTALYTVDGALNGVGTLNTGYFEGITSNLYWSGTTYGLNADYAWTFNTQSGLQDASLKSRTTGIYSLALRDGDVLAVPGPEAGTMLLAGLGLAGIAARRRASRKA